MQRFFARRLAVAGGLMLLAAGVVWAQKKEAPTPARPTRSGDGKAGAKGQGTQGADGAEFAGPSERWVFAAQRLAAHARRPADGAERSTAEYRCPWPTIATPWWPPAATTRII